MPAAADATAEHIRDVNTRYHDAAAGSYDAKWGIDFDEVGRDQVRMKIVKALGAWPEMPFRRSLEVGAGTGYFSLNLMQQGLMREATATDISPGMLASLSSNAERLGLEVKTVRGDAESLPFEDNSFDLVIGHAVLHHIPDLATAMSEFHRILEPGGLIIFCGEPSRYGDALAAAPKNFARLIAPLWRRAVGASAANGYWECDHDHALESEVDVHAFDPGALSSLMRGAGFVAARVRGEELLANIHGWTLRGIEASAEPSEIPLRWRRFAYHSYIALQRLDSRLLEPYLPAACFYNLILTARKPLV